MGLSKRQQMLIRIGEAVVNGDNPNPADVEYCRNTAKGGGNPRKGMSKKQFYKMMNLSLAYMVNMRIHGMDKDTAFIEARKSLDIQTVDVKSLEAFCAYARSNKPPPNPEMANDLLHARAAFQQLDIGYIKLPNHPNYKPLI